MHFEQFLCIVNHPHLRNQAEFGVLVVMARHARPQGDPEERLCWPGRETIAREARVTVRCAEQVLARLVARGFLSIENKGGGKGKATIYRLHAELGLPETKSEAPSPFTGLPSFSGFSPKGEGASPYKPNSEADSANEKAKGEPHSANGVPPYKEKHFSESYGSGGGVRAGACEASPPLPPPLPASPAILALCEVCGLMLDTMTKRDRQELKELLPWLNQLPENAGADSAAIAIAVHARFSPEIWDKPTPPRLSQIKPNWKRMEMIAARQQTVTALEVANGTDRSGCKSGSRNGYDSAAERRARGWDEWGSEIIKRTTALEGRLGDSV